MKEIFEHPDQQIANVSNRFTRYLFDRIHWSSRLIGIKGASSLSDLGTESEQDEILTQWNTTFEVRSGVTERESGDNSRH